MSDDPVDPVAAAARAAARQLAPMYDLPLEAGVEEALLGARTKESPTQYLDPISLGILIVAIATLAYQIYSDRKKNGGKPTRDNVTQEVQEERRKDGELTGVEEKIIAIVSAQIIIVAADDELSPSDRRRPGWRPAARFRAVRPVREPMGSAVVVDTATSSRMG